MIFTTDCSLEFVNAVGIFRYIVPKIPQVIGTKVPFQHTQNSTSCKNAWKVGQDLWHMIACQLDILQLGLILTGK